MMSTGKLRRHMKRAHRTYVSQQQHPPVVTAQQRLADFEEALRYVRRNLTERNAP